MVSGLALKPTGAEAAIASPSAAVSSKNVKNSKLFCLHRIVAFFPFSNRLKLVEIIDEAAVVDTAQVMKIP
jgi:hypothetical protein